MTTAQRRRAGLEIVVWRGYGSILSSTGSTWRLRMHSDPPSALLDRVRKLLAKAEAEGVTPPEAEALTAKAAELMARYGIHRARLAATRPAPDPPGSRRIDLANPRAPRRRGGGGREEAGAGVPGAAPHPHPLQRRRVRRGLGAGAGGRQRQRRAEVSPRPRPRLNRPAAAARGRSRPCRGGAARTGQT